jgi:hypothetical protein
MRRFLLAFLAIPSLACAAPFLEADLPDQTTTHCKMSIDGAAFGPEVPVTATTPKLCRMDLQGIATGAHDARLVAVASDPIWGRRESAPSVPFAFTRPGVATPPGGIRLVP